MISVCIPVYNYDVGELVEQLHQQLLQLGESSEIILIDDASCEEIRQVNRRIPSDHATLIELQGNIGRAGIRNRFPEHAKQPFLLFLDCDSVILSDRFIPAYLDTIKHHPGKIICGGIIYDLVKPGRSRMLHWKYGSKKESQPASIRNKSSNRSFMTANFLVPKNLLEQLQFDERITGYGHEDTLFGYRLSEMNQTIFHIDNPVLHAGLESNREFLQKTDEGLQNLFAITGFLGNDPKFTETITLLQYVSRLENKGIAWLILLLFNIFGPTVRSLLGLGFAMMSLFSFYKLGRYLAIHNKKKKKGD